LSPQDFTTGAPGLSADFQGAIDCPNEDRPCRGRWELSNGQASDQLTLGRVTFSQAGYYRGAFRAIGRTDASATAYVHVSAWSKSFVDDFNRPVLDPHRRGWREPSLERTGGPENDGGNYFFYAIENGLLRITGDTQEEGASALLAYPKITNGTVQFKIRRASAPTPPADAGADASADAVAPLPFDHVTDVVLRYDPTRPDGAFYRVHVHEYEEQGGLNRGEIVELAIFRVTRAQNQHGRLMNNRAPYWQNPAVGPNGVPQQNDGGVQSVDLVGYRSPPGPIVETNDDGCVPSAGHPTGQSQYPPSDPGCPTTVPAARAQEDAYRVEVSAQDRRIIVKLFALKLPTGPERLILADVVTDNAPDAIVGSGLWGLAHFNGITYVDDFRLESTDP
jgi:hypothetical protein